ncbi:hypothetical protein EDD16DRAFT_197898 [Pisolithus croceorrhizus]|nr:hypothetical protein EDD16DRAFT_197898 [Pisolithus croceorrhizus]KAI6114644.1 hypothetical protein EV401DRAFT_138434 [Pisolithus croceorrhizus]KAI6160551.1 hypothetical protein EDD17DRAFT_793557 [Pisolithus thermaeus]
MHPSRLLDRNENSRQYSVQEFFRITRSTNTDVKIVACDLYRISSLSSCRHEFLVVQVDVGIDAEDLVLIIEHVHGNNGIRVGFSDGVVAKDIITVVRAREIHEYWRGAGQPLVFKGALRWPSPYGSSPHLSDIAVIANAASAVFEHCSGHVQQCYWYGRVILALIAKRFQTCSKEGTTSFSKRKFAIFGGFKMSQVQFLVDLYTACGRDTDVCPPALIVTPDSFRVIRSFLARYLKNCLVQLLGPGLRLRS